MIRASRTRWRLKKNPSTPTYSTLKARSINMGYQHGASHTSHENKKTEKKKANVVANPCCGIYMRHKDKTARKMREREKGKREGKRETERLADPLLAILDRSAVAMATSSPRLVFGAASGITAEDLMFSTHLGSANMALQSATPFCSRHTALANPLFGTRRLAPASHRHQNLSPSARLTDSSLHPDRCLCCHVHCRTGRCKQSMCCASLSSTHCWLCENECFSFCPASLKSSRSDFI